MKPHAPRKVYCCGCWQHVQARFCSGKEIYPHRPDLSDKIFWKCDTCGNYVGCHRNTARPLGVIPTPELRAARQRVHAAIDPFWKDGRISRTELYHKISCRIGEEFHTANMIRVSDADKIIAIANEIMERHRAHTLRP